MEENQQTTPCECTLEQGLSPIQCGALRRAAIRYPAEDGGIQLNEFGIWSVGPFKGSSLADLANKLLIERAQVDAAKKTT